MQRYSDTHVGATTGAKAPARRPPVPAEPVWLMAGMVVLDRPLRMHEQQVFEALVAELAGSLRLHGLIELAGTRVLVVQHGAPDAVHSAWNLLKCHPRVAQAVLICEEALDHGVFHTFETVRTPEDTWGRRSRIEDLEQIARALQQAGAQLQGDGHPVLADVVRNFIDWERLEPTPLG